MDALRKANSFALRCELDDVAASAAHRTNAFLGLQEVLDGAATEIPQFLLRWQGLAGAIVACVDLLVATWSVTRTITVQREKNRGRRLAD
jgi:hypothetical protein